jgi:uncharacterized membrane protein
MAPLVQLGFDSYIITSLLSLAYFVGAFLVLVSGRIRVLTSFRHAVKQLLLYLVLALHFPPLSYCSGAWGSISCLEVMCFLF